MSNAVPEGWHQITIGDVGKVVTGSTPSTKDAEYWDGDIPFISPADFNGSVYVGKTGRTLTESGAKKGRLLPRDSILVTCIGSLGGIAMSSKESTTNQQINAVIPEGDENPHYHYYNILFNIDELEKNAGTTTLPIINKSTFEQINLLRAPLPEQQKIAAILSSVDDVIEKTQAQIDKLKDLKTGMMQELLTKGIGEGGKRHTEFKDSPVGRIPVEWDVVESSDLCNLITKGTTPTSLGFGYKDSGINFIKVESIVRNGVINKNKFSFIDEETNRALSRSVIHEGDILITIAGATVGKLAMVNQSHLPANTNQALAIVRIDSKKINRSYLYYWLQSEYIAGVIASIQTVGAQPNLSLAQIGGFNVALPSMLEQEKIVATLSSIDKKMDLTVQKRTQVELSKKALMQDLLTGKVRVKVDQ